MPDFTTLIGTLITGALADFTDQLVVVAGLTFGVAVALLGYRKIKGAIR